MIPKEVYLFCGGVFFSWIDSGFLEYLAARSYTLSSQEPGFLQEKDNEDSIERLEFFLLENLREGRLLPIFARSSE